MYFSTSTLRIQPMRILSVGILTFAMSTADIATAQVNSTNALSYEKCTSANSYLENGISDTLKTLLFPSASCSLLQTQISMLATITASPTVQDLKCIKTAQEISNLKHFVSCASPQSMEVEKKPKPCVSAGNVELTARAFKLASKCVGLNEKEMFGLFNHESGMLLNVKSGSGAAGPAQLTPPAIKDYRELYEIYKDRKLATESDQTMMEIELLTKKPECEIFGSAIKGAQVMGQITPSSLFDILPPTPKNDQDCSILAFPRNPLMSFYWGMVNYRVARDVMRNSVKKWNAKRTKKLSPGDVEKLIVGLTRISYNGGRDTIHKLFLNYKSGITSETTTADQILKGFSTYIATNYSPGTAARRQEVALYYQKTLNDLALLEKTTGSCFVPVLHTSSTSSKK